jgi:hypothetical protein
MTREEFIEKAWDIVVGSFNDDEEWGKLYDEMMEDIDKNNFFANVTI